MSGLQIVGPFEFQSGIQMPFKFQANSDPVFDTLHENWTTLCTEFKWSYYLNTGQKLNTWIVFKRQSDDHCIVNDCKLNLYVLRFFDKKWKPFSTLQGFQVGICVCYVKWKHPKTVLSGLFFVHHNPVWRKRCVGLDGWIGLREQKTIVNKTV